MDSKFNSNNTSWKEVATGNLQNNDVLESQNSESGFSREKNHGQPVLCMCTEGGSEFAVN